MPNNAVANASNKSLAHNARSTFPRRGGGYKGHESVSLLYMCIALRQRPEDTGRRKAVLECTANSHPRKISRWNKKQHATRKKRPEGEAIVEAYRRAPTRAITGVPPASPTRIPGPDVRPQATVVSLFVTATEDAVEARDARSPCYRLTVERLMASTSSGRGFRASSASG